MGIKGIEYILNPACLGYIGVILRSYRYMGIY